MRGTTWFSAVLAFVCSSASAQSMDYFHHSHQLKSVSPNQIEYMAREARRRGVLRLDRLRELTDGVARALHDHPCPVSLAGIKELSAERASLLVTNRSGFSLFLDGLTELPLSIAQALVPEKDAQREPHEPWVLSLRGVQTVSPEVAKVLARHKGILVLDGLTTLSDEAAVAFSEFKGEAVPKTSLGRGWSETRQAIEGLDEGGLTLRGLTLLSDKAAKTLSANCWIKLPAKLRR